MNENIEKMIKKILISEGGFTIDHAGPTNFGITIGFLSMYLGRLATIEDIKNLNENSASRVYRWALSDYYKITWINDEDLLYLVYDSMVNSGKEQVELWLQQSSLVKIDGVIGNKTKLEVNKNSKIVYKNLLVLRIKFLCKLCSKNPDKYLKFLNGWIDRICKNFIL